MQTGVPASRTHGSAQAYPQQLARQQAGNTHTEKLPHGLGESPSL